MTFSCSRAYYIEPPSPSPPHSRLEYFVSYRIRPFHRTYNFTHTCVYIYETKGAYIQAARSYKPHTYIKKNRRWMHIFGKFSSERASFSVLYIGFIVSEKSKLYVYQCFFLIFSMKLIDMVFINMYARACALAIVYWVHINNCEIQNTAKPQRLVE